MNNVDDILATNPNVNQELLEASLKLQKQLSDAGWRPRGYRVATPQEVEVVCVDLSAAEQPSHSLPIEDAD